MTSTSWKEVYNKLRMNGLINGGAQGGRGSDEASSMSSGADTFTSGTPKYNHRSSLADQEWQMNYYINRRDGL